MHDFLSFLSCKTPQRLKVGLCTQLPLEKVFLLVPEPLSGSNNFCSQTLSCMSKCRL